MSLKKVRIQLLDETTGAVVEEVDVVTSAESVMFSDGETFQQKLDLGKLKGSQGERGATGTQGPKGDAGVQGAKGDKGDTGLQGTPGAKGDKGDTGAKGATGATGAKGEDGDGVKVGSDLGSATSRKIFFKVI